MAIFSRQEIEEGLRRLGELAQSKRLHIELTLVGGAVMVLRFNARPSTRDVDAVILSPGLVGVTKGPLVFQASGIEAHAPSLEQLLAMKLSAWRDDVDISDARRLMQEVGRGRKRDEVWQSLEPYLVKGDELTAQYAFLDLWESLYESD